SCHGYLLTDPRMTCSAVTARARVLPGLARGGATREAGRRGLRARSPCASAATGARKDRAAGNRRRALRGRRRLIRGGPPWPLPLEVAVGAGSAREVLVEHLLPGVPEKV